MKKLLSIFLFLPSLAMAICNPFVPGSLTADMLNNALSVGCITSGTINNAVVGNITPAAGYFTTLSSTTGVSGPIAATTLSASSSVSGVGFSNYWANPPILGGSAPNVVNGSVFNGAGTGLTGTASALSVGSAVSATNVAGGTAGAIPYQSGVGATGFISPGTATYILTSNGAGVAPTFQSAGSVYNPTAVAITGGTINGTAIGGTTAAAVTGTTVTANTQFTGPGTGLTGTAAGLSIGGNAATATAVPVSGITGVSNLSATLAADYTIPSATVFSNVIGLTLGTGTWVVSVHTEIYSPNVATPSWKITDGTSVFCSGAISAAFAGGVYTLSTTCLISNPVGQVIFAMTGGGVTTLVVKYNYSTLGKDTQMFAYRIN